MTGTNKNEQARRALAIIEGLRVATRIMTPPAAYEIVQEFGQDPFLILVSCILSLRTKDTVSLPASKRLFAHAKTPHQLVRLSLLLLQQLIYPTGFYIRKSQQLHALSAMIIEKYNGIVPSDEDQLLALPGVGRKTMNLVRGEGFGIPALCVDTHVHRISNRLGLVQTATPHETEQALKELLPSEYWIEYNRLLVVWGQNICVPISPKCSMCPIAPLCPKTGVKTHR
jgi:endonuclease-3